MEEQTEDDEIENLLDQPDHSPHELEVLRESAEFAARVVQSMERRIVLYEERHHITITQTDRLAMYRNYFAVLLDDEYDEDEERWNAIIEVTLEESSTDHAVPG